MLIKMITWCLGFLIIYHFIRTIILHRIVEQYITCNTWQQIYHMSEKGSDEKEKKSALGLNTISQYMFGGNPDTM